ncbi:hypothetical protein LQ327_23985 [Actinomycetospora endophytica]|uniref:Uncharacterized protein n=1 Tax=Actinomycetospora endophytica TaxID=2291215 RepID=A0ABS8PDT2_9PSEU|nr:hypothetical protein [Actinomycetospora endophytica]MCD2196440.1 hypothetical protein [Actinomycetospora endophytica]
MRRTGRRIEGLTAWDVALVQRVRQGGSVRPDEWLRFASGVENLDARLEVDDGFDDCGYDDDGCDEDLRPLPCDGSVCCPCGRCPGLELARGVDTPSRGDEQHRRPTARVSGQAVGPER